MEHWYALHTKPRKELLVRNLLQSRGIETYLPALFEPARRSPHATREQPFFARYLFAHLDLSRVPLSSLNWTQGVTQVVSFGGQPAVVQDAVIEWLQDRLGQLNSQSEPTATVLHKDDRLRVMGGPLKGVAAIFDRRLSAEDRARVLIRLLGQLTACEIPLAWLERA